MQPMDPELVKLKTAAKICADHGTGLIETLLNYHNALVAIRKSPSKGQMKRIAIQALGKQDELDAEHLPDSTPIE